jgi:D-alanine-D-alanine ligase-like ATP-grasp enzyme
VPELAANRGITYSQLCALMVEDASIDR